MNLLNCIIVDDEERATNLLKNLLKKYCTNVNVLGSTNNLHDAYLLITELNPDLVFLDIEMPGGSGFDLLERFEEPPFDIIFVTAFQEYAIRAIRLAALDYILKPIDIDQLNQAVERAKRKKNRAHLIRQVTQLKDNLTSSAKADKIILSNSDDIYSLPFDQIIYCQSSGSYTEFHLAGNKKILTSKNIKEYEDILLPNNFFRIHKSYIVNINHIIKINKADDYTLLLSNKVSLPIAIRRKEAFLKFWSTN